MKERIPFLIRDRDVHAAFRRVFDTPDGKTVLNQIMKDGFVFRSTFVQGDPHKTSMNEGSRRLALGIVQYFAKDHGDFVRRVEEGIRDESEQHVS